MITNPTVQTVKNKSNGSVNNQSEIERLVSGKDKTENVVNLEINDNVATLFIERNGTITKETRPNKFWILSSKRRNASVKLAGNLNYCWGNQFSNQRDWYSAVTKARKANEDIYTVYDLKEAHLIKDGICYFKGMKHTDPSILSFDIESTGLYHNEDSKVLLISNTFRKNGKVIRKLFAYDEYPGTVEFLQSWVEWVNSIDPSLICGHNIYSYDLPYLNYIASQVGMELNLGRDGSALRISNKASKFRIDGSREQEYHKCRVYGRELIDTYFLAIKHDIVAKKYESYGLKSIIKAEGLEKKDRQHYDSSQIRFNYQDPVEWAKIKEYCIHDSDDALTLYDLTAPASFYLTQSVPKPFQNVVETATGAQINAMMVRSYLQDGHSIPKPDQTYPFPGAISRGKPGVYKNCVRWDVSSLYPSIMLQYNVYDEDKDPKCNFLKILRELTNKRLEYKKIAKETGDPYYEGLQSSTKILVNSFYGFLAAPGLQFNSVPCADFVTDTGRKILAKGIEWASGIPFEEWDKQFNE